MEINQPSVSKPLTVTDGSHTVSNVVNITFSGATVSDGGGGIADVTIVSSGGTVTNVTSNDGSITVATPTTTPDLSVVKAPRLSTPRTINGVSFDGTANITITAAAGTLTGTTLNSTVVTSSLTSVGVITSGTMSSGAVIGGVTMTLGSDAAYDTYYRNSSGILTRLPNGTTNQILTATTSAAPSWIAPAATSLTIGTTTIVSGTSSRILYDNAGVLGEYTTTGNGTVVVMQSSPTITTPTILQVNSTTNNPIEFNAGTYTPIQAYTPSSGSTATLDFSKGNIHRITMPAGNVTIAFSNTTTGQCCLVDVIQDATGGRTVTWPTIKWAGGTTPTLTTTGNKIDTLGILVVNVASTYQGYVVGQNI